MAHGYFEQHVRKIDAGLAIVELRAVDAPNVCRHCGEDIWQYVHSQAGPLQASAWSTIREDNDDDEDPRYGTACRARGDWPRRHEPEE